MCAGVIAGIEVWGRGIGARVRGSKGGGVVACSDSAGWVLTIGDACTLTSGTKDAALTSGTRAPVLGSGSREAGAGLNAVARLSEGLASDRSADDGRMGDSSCADGTVTDGGVTIGTADFGCSAICGGGTAADTGSKLNGLLCSLGGGSGESGEIA
jgi:hypothetical protein